MSKAASKVQATILIAAILFASVGAYYFTRDGLKTKPAATPPTPPFQLKWR